MHYPFQSLDSLGPEGRWLALQYLYMEARHGDISIAQNKLWITYDLHSSGDMQTYAGYTDGIKAISAELTPANVMKW
ncbi:MAG: hypothetical protein PUF74_07655, partial [Sodaliphilus pleomorphus]|nr:hypothetical protein [Sodaliphilus pleomorphus]